MNIHITGGKGPAVVFLHGFCETMNIWNNFSEVLADQYNVITLDLPGHGASPLESATFSIDDLADQVHDTLQRHGINKYFVIGHSLGGYISLALTELYDKHVTGYGLLSSTTFADDDEKKKVRDKVSEFIAEHGHQNFIDSFLPNLFTPENRRRFSEEIEQLKREAYQTSTKSIVSYSQAMKNRPDRSKLLTQAKPKFIIVGDRDMAVKIEASRLMMEHVDSQDCLILVDTGHNGFVESFPTCIEFILNFLSRNTTSL